MAQQTSSSEMFHILPSPSGQLPFPNDPLRNVIEWAARIQQSRLYDQLNVQNTSTDNGPEYWPARGQTNVPDVSYASQNKGVSGVIGYQAHACTALNVMQYEYIYRGSKQYPSYLRTKPGEAHASINYESALAAGHMADRTAQTMTHKFKEVYNAEEAACELNFGIGTKGARRTAGLNPDIDPNIYYALRETPPFAEGDVLARSKHPEFQLSLQGFASRALHKYMELGGNSDISPAELEETFEAYRELQHYFPGFPLALSGREKNLFGEPGTKTIKTLVTDLVRPDAVVLGPALKEQRDPSPYDLALLKNANSILRARHIFGILDPFKLDPSEFLIIQEVFKHLGEKYCLHVIEMKTNMQLPRVAPEMVAKKYSRQFLGACGSICANIQQFLGTNEKLSVFIERVFQSGGIKPELLIVTSPYVTPDRNPFTTSADLINNTESQGYHFPLNKLIPEKEMGATAVAMLADRVRYNGERQKEMQINSILRTIAGKLAPKPQNADPEYIIALAGKLEKARRLLRSWTDFAVRDLYAGPGYGLDIILRADIEYIPFEIV